MDITHEEALLYLWYQAIDALLRGKGMTDPEVLLYIWFKRIIPILRGLG